MLATERPSKTRAAIAAGVALATDRVRRRRAGSCADRVERQDRQAFVARPEQHHVVRHVVEALLRAEVPDEQAHRVAAALDALVAGLPDDGWARPTPAPGWTVAHQIAHLWWTDRVALTLRHAGATMPEDRLHQAVELHVRLVISFLENPVSDPARTTPEYVRDLAATYLAPMIY